MRALACLFAVASFAAWGQMPKNEVRDRGQTRPADESQSWTRGRLGTQKPLPGKLVTLNGTLIDASCGDRSAFNVDRPAQPLDLAPPPTPSAEKGGAVPPADVAAHRTPDVPMRQADRSCAITAATRGFALVTTDGRLLNLDEGGNTLATQAVYANAAGRAMLNGNGPSVKPQATIRGRVEGDRLVVDKFVKM